jgi:hypothetical protein
MWRIAALVAAVFGDLSGHPASAAQELGPEDCQPAQIRAIAEPHAPGPLKLRTAYCALSHGARDRGCVTALSPDGRHMAFFPLSSEEGPLRLRDMAAPTLALRAYELTKIRHFPLNLRWRRDSTAIWATVPLSESGSSNWVRPAIVGLDGTIMLMPELRHQLGPVRSLHWVGDKGLAIAEFRDPAISDRVTHKILPPAFAIVDAATGSLLDSFEPQEFENIRKSDPSVREFFYPWKIAASQLRDGRARALMDFSAWVLWTQGESPRAHRDLPLATGAALSADGNTVLLFRPKLPGQDNRRDDIVCDEGQAERHPICPEREPKMGTWASLHDVETGHMIWSLPWKFDRRDRVQRYSLSPDGRFALISLPSQTDRFKNLIGVISMRDGKIVQTMSSPERSNDFEFGFTSGGRGAWVATWNATALYDID